MVSALGASLVVFGGLPGVGKSTVARQLAERLSATYLRIDTIEQTLRRVAAITDMGPIGYEVAYSVASDNLRAGRVVIADSVNPIEITRAAWRAVAAGADCPCLEVELWCSDSGEHRRRVETRTADIEGHVLPTWNAVCQREYEVWSCQLRVDTATTSVPDAVQRIAAAMKRVDAP